MIRRACYLHTAHDFISTEFSHELQKSASSTTFFLPLCRRRDVLFFMQRESTLKSRKL